MTPHLPGARARTPKSKIAGDRPGRLGTVYVITNTTNDKAYVGGTIQRVGRRWNQHRRALVKGKHHTPHLQHSWGKHGEVAFVFAVIETDIPAEDLVAREQHHLDERLRAFDRNCTYNACLVAGSPRGLRRSEETKAKLRAAILGKRHTPEAKRKIAEAMRLRPVSDETRARLSAAGTGKKHSPQRRANISAACMGRNKGKRLTPQEKARILDAKGGTWHSKESRRKLSLANSGRRHTPETRQALSRLNTGKRHTPEAKRKISEARRSRHALATQQQAPAAE